MPLPEEMWPHPIKAQKLLFIFNWTDREVLFFYQQKRKERMLSCRSTQAKLAPKACARLMNNKIFFSYGRLFALAWPPRSSPEVSLAASFVLSKPLFKCHLLGQAFLNHLLTIVKPMPSRPACFLYSTFLYGASLFDILYTLWIPLFCLLLVSPR